MGQIYKFRGSSINGDSEHFTVLKEDEWEKGNLCRQRFGWNEGSIKELEHAFIDAFTGTGWGVDLVHLYYPDLIVVKRDNKDQGIQLFQKWRQYLICIQHIKICNRFRLMNKYKCLSVNSKESLMQVNRNRIGRRQSIRVTYQIFNV